jgi:iron-sulfur cluster repair protein YtfE (RIC family)
MNLTDALLGEHALFCALFHRLEEQAMRARTVQVLQGAIAVISEGLISHARIEDELLLRPLEAHAPPGGPLAVIHGEHEEIESSLAALAGIDSLIRLRSSLMPILELTRAHFRKEEEVFFPMARHHLGERKLQELGRRWTDLREVVDPAGNRSPRSAVQPPVRG